MLIPWICEQRIEFIFTLFIQRRGNRYMQTRMYFRWCEQRMINKTNEIKLWINCFMSHCQHKHRIRFHKNKNKNICITMRFSLWHLSFWCIWKLKSLSNGSNRLKNCISVVSPFHILHIYSKAIHRCLICRWIDSRHLSIHNYLHVIIKRGKMIILNDVAIVRLTVFNSLFFLRNRRLKTNTIHSACMLCIFVIFNQDYSKPIINSIHLISEWKNNWKCIRVINAGFGCLIRSEFYLFLWFVIEDFVADIGMTKTVFGSGSVPAFQRCSYMFFVPTIRSQFQICFVA